MEIYNANQYLQSSETCRHCNRGRTVCGHLDDDGFCEFCIKSGHKMLWFNLNPDKMIKEEIEEAHGKNCRCGACRG